MDPRLTILKKIEPTIAILALLIATLMYSCVPEKYDSHSELSKDLCSKDQRISRFIWKTGGFIQQEELIKLSQNLRKSDLPTVVNNETIEIGYFNYYKEIVTKPPFKAPSEFLCQTLKFKTAEDTVIFQKTLKPAPAILAITGPGLGYANAKSIKAIIVDAYHDPVLNKLSFSMYEIKLATGGNRYIMITAYKQYLYITHFGNLEQDISQTEALTLNSDLIDIATEE